MFEDIQNPKYNLFKQTPTKKVYKDPNDRVKQTFAFENGIKMLLGKEFGGKASGFDVRIEARNFRPSQFNSPILLDIKDQMEGRIGKVAEISFKGKYLCDVNESMKPNEVIAIIQMAVLDKVSKSV